MFEGAARLDNRGVLFRGTTRQRYFFHGLLGRNPCNLDHSWFYQMFMSRLFLYLLHPRMRSRLFCLLVLFLPALLFGNPDGAFANGSCFSPEAANTELSQISHTDSLTQIANRRSFDRQLALEYKSATRGGYPLALVMIDIDHFKQFNDTYGHQVGDKVLRAVAKTLKPLAARPGDSIYRYGGEEFAVLLSNTDLAGSTIVAEKMRKSIEMTAVLIHDRSFFITISAGLCIYNPRDHIGMISSPEDLMHQADIQLYKAKEKGRNRLEVWRDEEPS